MFFVFAGGSGGVGVSVIICLDVDGLRFFMIGFESVDVVFFRGVERFRG